MNDYSYATPARRRHARPMCKPLALAVALALGLPLAVFAAPATTALPVLRTGGASAGTQITQTTGANPTMVVTSTTASSINNWTSFSIGSAAAVRLNQPTANSVSLNRVVPLASGAPIVSEIDGALASNGKVFLVNTSGVLFGAGASVNVGSLVASTLGITDADFLAGNYRFTNDGGNGTVRNAGAINALGRLNAAGSQIGGTVALFGANVSNTGTISAQLGTVALAAGNNITLDFNGDGLTKIVVDPASVVTLIENGGAIQADGGQVIMTAKAADSLVSSMVRNTGTVRARSLSERNGKLVLDGGSDGAVTVGGTLDAAGAHGGDVAITGHDVSLQDGARIDVSGTTGGGTVFIGKAADSGALANTSNLTMASGATIVADATGSGHGGQVTLTSDGTTSYAGTVSAQGGPAAGDGGSIMTTVVTASDNSGVMGFRADASSAHGVAGTWALRQTAGLTVDSDTAAAIAQALGTTTNVAVNSADTITMDSTILASNARTATLSFNAGTDITFNQGAAIQATVAPLNVNLNANAANGGAGAIAMNDRSAILSNGGDIALYGGSDKGSGYATGDANNRNGVNLTGATLDTRVGQSDDGAGGNVLVRGLGAGIGVAGGGTRYGVNMEDVTIRTASGNIDMAGLGGAGVYTGEGEGDASIQAASDGIDLYLGAPGTGLSSTSGAIRLTGRDGSQFVTGDAEGGWGVYVYMQPGFGAGIASSRGDITLAGVAASPGSSAYFGGYGIELYGDIASGGALSLSGMSQSGQQPGVHLENARLATTGGGTLSIIGRGAGGDGVDMGNTSIKTVPGEAGNGNVIIAGESGTGSGLRFDGVIIGGTGDIGSGDEARFGPGVSAASVTTAMTGDVAISALNNGGAASDVPMINTQSGAGTAIGTRGVTSFRPAGVSSAGVITEAPAVAISVGAGTNPFQVTLSDFGLGTSQIDVAGQLVNQRVVIGSSAQTGAISYGDSNGEAGPYLLDLTLQNDGVGSGGIGFGTPLNVAGAVTLSSGGTVDSTQLPVWATSLLLHGAQSAANFQLTNPGNVVGTLATVFDTTRTTASAGSVNFYNNGALTLGALSGDASTITATGSTVAGDIVVQANGALTLGQNLTSGSGNITLVAGTVLTNAGSYTLTAGPGKVWDVYADTWVGETRGGLAGALPLPNIYNCAYLADCAATKSGNQFIYRAQPTVTLTGDNQTRIYGDANPALTYTTDGLINGDTAATSLSGAYTTAATAASNVGSYGTAGSFTSPAGYLVVTRPGALAIDPAPLRIVAADQNKVYGAADPALIATFSGLKLDDTSAVVSGLQLTTTTGAAATAGTHAITASGAAAQNYAITYQPGTLTVAKALLTVAADDKSKQYGAADPGLSATLTGFHYDDTRDVITGLQLATVTGAAATAGTHAITASNATAANYVVQYQPGLLSVSPAVLTYTATPATQVAGAAPRTYDGSVGGFVYGESAATATTGALAFTSTATAASPAGTYAINGSGLAAVNYTFVQAPLNATALLIQAATVAPPPVVDPMNELLAAVSEDRPSMARNVTFETSDVYANNIGAPRVCIATGSFAGSAGDVADALGMEWSRVRVSPNLSNCLSMGTRNSCQDF